LLKICSRNLKHLLKKYLRFLSETRNRPSQRRRDQIEPPPLIVVTGNLGLLSASSIEIASSREAFGNDLASIGQTLLDGACKTAS
jgi:hypothetical protein